jgi:hypothetical protein
VRKLCGHCGDVPVGEVKIDVGRDVERQAPNGILGFRGLELHRDTGIT